MCSNSLIKLFKFLGTIMNILKVVIPIILIVVLTVEILSYITKRNLDNPPINKLIKKIVITILIFFIPIIVYFIFDNISSTSDNNCLKCFNNPNDEVCDIKESENRIEKNIEYMKYSELESTLQISHMSQGKEYTEQNIGNITCPIWFNKIINDDIENYTSIRYCSYIDDFNSECTTNYLDDSKWINVNNNIESSYTGDTKNIVYVAFNTKTQKWVKSKVYSMNYSPKRLEESSKLKLSFCSKYQDFSNTQEIIENNSDSVIIINGSNYDIESSWYQFSVNGQAFTGFGESDKNTIMHYFSFPLNNMRNAKIKWRVKSSDDWIESDEYYLEVRN